MITFLVGKVRDVKQVTRKDKTGAETASTGVLVDFEMRDKDGHLVGSRDTISFPLSEMTKLVNTIDKFIMIPHLTINTKSGTYTFPNVEDVGYLIFDKDPLTLAINKK